MSRQDLAWPAGYNENGKQMDSKFLKHSVQSMERERKCVRHPHPFPPFSPARHSLCSIFYLTEIKVLISPFWKWCHFFFFLALAESRFITNLLCDWWLWRDKAEGETHLGKVWNSRDRLTIKLAVREMTKDKEKQRLSLNISSIFSSKATEIQFLFPSQVYLKAMPWTKTRFVLFLLRRIHF